MYYEDSISSMDFCAFIVKTISSHAFLCVYCKDVILSHAFLTLEAYSEANIHGSSGENSLKT